MAFLSYLLIIAFLCNSHNPTTATRIGVLLNSPKSLPSPMEKLKGLTPLPKPELPPLPPIPPITPPLAPETLPTPTSSKSPSFEPSLTPTLPPKQAPKSFFPKPSKSPPKSKSPAPKAFLPPPELAPTTSSISPSTTPAAPETFFEPIQSPLATVPEPSSAASNQPLPKTLKPPISKHEHHQPILPKFPKLKCPPFFPWIPKTSPAPSSH